VCDEYEEPEYDEPESLISLPLASKPSARLLSSANASPPPNRGPLPPKIPFGSVIAPYLQGTRTNAPTRRGQVQ
jgi:hypothetical protein